MWLASWTCYTCVAMLTFRLRCSGFYVDVRLREFNGKWIASADTADGLSLGVGTTATQAVESCLVPFEGMVEALLDSLPVALTALADP